MDSLALERRLARQLEQREKSITQRGDLADLLSTTIFGSFRGDLEHIERIHSLLYNEFQTQSTDIYRRALAQLDGNGEELLPEVVETIDRVLRDWCQALVRHSLRCVETVSGRLERSNAPNFRSSSAAFARTVTDLLNDTKADAMKWIVNGETAKPEKRNAVAKNIVTVTVQDHSSLTMHDMNVRQRTSDSLGDVDLGLLASELAQLRAEMRGRATETSHDRSVGAVAAAEEAARRGDKTSVAKYLKDSGKWAWECATKIGVSLATEAIKNAIGIGRP